MCLTPGKGQKRVVNTCNRMKIESCGAIYQAKPRVNILLLNPAPPVRGPVVVLGGGDSCDRSTAVVVVVVVVVVVGEGGMHFVSSSPLDRPRSRNCKRLIRLSIESVALIAPPLQRQSD